VDERRHPSRQPGDLLLAYYPPARSPVSTVYFLSVSFSVHITYRFVMLLPGAFPHHSRFIIEAGKGA